MNEKQSEEDIIREFQQWRHGVMSCHSITLVEVARYVLWRENKGQQPAQDN